MKDNESEPSPDSQPRLSSHWSGEPDGQEAVHTEEKGKPYMGETLNSLLTRLEEKRQEANRPEDLFVSAGSTKGERIS